MVADGTVGVLDGLVPEKLLVEANCYVWDVCRLLGVCVASA